MIPHAHPERSLRARLARALGVGPGPAVGLPPAAGAPRVEVRPSAGAHGAVSAALTPGHPGRLGAELVTGGRVRARFAGAGGVRFGGPVVAGAQLRLAAAGPVTLVVVAADGRVLAGPAEVGPDRPWATLQW